MAEELINVYFSKGWAAEATAWAFNWEVDLSKMTFNAMIRSKA